MSEPRTSCEEYGHNFEECQADECGPSGCDYMVCSDCGDEYED